jgi:hypothetical protein
LAALRIAGPNGVNTGIEFGREELALPYKPSVNAKGRTAAVVVRGAGAVVHDFRHPRGYRVICIRLVQRQIRVRRET